MVVKLIAEHSHIYGTRRLLAGDEYEATDMDASLLVAVQQARYAPGKVPDEIERLRAEAIGLGIEVDMRWGARRLRHEIDVARS